MEISRKCNKVRKICDGSNSTLKLKGYIMFEDNWISECDEILYDKDGNSFPVLGFQETEETVLLMPEIMPHFNGWKLRKFSCVKLDKNVKIGEIFYNIKKY